jgi:hypothetical protein
MSPKVTLIGHSVTYRLLSAGWPGGLWAASDPGVTVSRHGGFGWAGGALGGLAGGCWRMSGSLPGCPAAMACALLFVDPRRDRGGSGVPGPDGAAIPGPARESPSGPWGLPHPLLAARLDQGSAVLVCFARTARYRPSQELRPARGSPSSTDRCCGIGCPSWHRP